MRQFVQKKKKISNLHGKHLLEKKESLKENIIL